MSRDFVGALLQLNAEKQISREQLIGAVEDGIQSAYRRVAGDEDIHVRIDAETGKIRVFRARRVVDEIEDEIHRDDGRRGAQASTRRASVGDLVETEQLDGDVFGRIGAQTAKQIVLQRIREVERDQVFDQFASREGELMTGTVNRVEPRAIILDVGKNVEAILATTEQSAARALPHRPERQGVRARGPALDARARRSSSAAPTRASCKRLFELEVPEIHSGTVEIKAIAREAGSRSKVAVASRQEGLDPVGATVGQRGARVQAVVAELSGEKIDVIPWSDDAGRLRGQRPEPGPGDLRVDIDEEHRIASVTVPERMLSLAIGREGQNARLAARLTGWRIDIRSDVSVAEAKAAAAEAATDVAADGAGRAESAGAPRPPAPAVDERRRPKPRPTAPAKPQRVDQEGRRRRPPQPRPPAAEATAAGARRSRSASTKKAAGRGGRKAERGRRRRTAGRRDRGQAGASAEAPRPKKAAAAASTEEVAS